MKLRIANNPIKITVSVIALLLVAMLVSWQVLMDTSRAADIKNFNPGNLMSDAVMSNKDTMTVQDIQNFLNSKNYCDNRNTHMAAWYPHLQYSIKDGKFVCMAREDFNGKSAAQLIWNASQEFNINPQVLIVLLEKEQGLVSDTWPNHVQYRTATGFGCPDTAPCDSQYYGLENQLRLAAKLFRDVLNGGWSNYPVGQRYVQYHPNAACGGSIVNIQNRATSALYRYTPYQPNKSALEAGYGTGDDCGAYGNRNFWRLFTDWFGSSIHIGDDQIEKKYNNLTQSGVVIGQPLGSSQVTTNNGLYRLYENGVIYWSKASGANSVISGATRDKFRMFGLEQGPMGYPMSDELPAQNAGTYQLFQGAILYKSPSTGAQVIFSGFFRDKYRASGLESGPLGYPTTDRICGLKDDGCFQSFQRGTIYHTKKLGTYSVIGKNRDHYRKMGLDNGALGYPISDEITGLKNNHSYQLFEKGVMYSNTTSTVSVLSGPTRNAYRRSGLENGTLGFPLEEESDNVQKFEGGYIYNGYTLSNNSYRLFTSEDIGEPNGDINCTLERNGCFQVFSKGILYESPSGVFLVPRGAILDKFRKLGRETGTGYPISKATAESQEFEKTIIRL